MPNQAEKSIFLNALELEAPAARREYLVQACGDDSELLAAVESLLGAHERSENPLDSPLAVAAAQVISGGQSQSAVESKSGGQLTAGRSELTDATVDEPATSSGGDIGRTIDGYRLMEQIGEGGFGLVFVAQQEKPVRRKVALKIIKPGTGSSEVLARFDAERQAVALMDHPHIAQVFDAGVTEDARPYFVMELVRGIPITQFCQQRGLNLLQRLELFEDVCAATHHAHQKGVIHRDLKPSNVLVTLHDTKPIAKVIDFGVAKAIGTSLTDQTIYTRLFSMVGTPLYMSPEQASMSGLDVDTRSDIYSLGVMLYELLTGTTPFDRTRLDTVGYDEMRRIIREEEPPRPSTRLTTINRGATNTFGNESQHDQRKAPGQPLPSRHGDSRLHSIPSDLDWIVMKAMDKDRSRRYESAAAMAADIRRFLLQEPIEARPPSRAYRLSKFASRNRAGLVTAVLVATALMIGSVVSLYQASVAIDERNKKDIALQEAIAARNEATKARMEVEQFTTRLKNANALLGEARTYEDEDQFEAAAENYDQAVELVPNYYLVWVRRAQLRLRENQWAPAAADFSNAMNLDAPIDDYQWQGVPALFALTGRLEDHQRICSLMLKAAGGVEQEMNWNTIRACLAVVPDQVDPEELVRQAEQRLAEGVAWENELRRGERRPPQERNPSPTFNAPPPAPGGFRGPPRDRPNPRFDGPVPRGRGGPDRFPGPGPRSRGFFLPPNVQQYIAGWANLRSGRYDRAIELLDAASQDNRWHAAYVTLALKAIAHHQAGHNDLAEAMLRRSNEEFARIESEASDESTATRFWMDYVEGKLTNREANRLILGTNL